MLGWSKSAAGRSRAEARVSESATVWKRRDSRPVVRHNTRCATSTSWIRSVFRITGKCDRIAGQRDGLLRIPVGRLRDALQLTQRCVLRITYSELQSHCVVSKFVVSQY